MENLYVKIHVGLVVLIFEDLDTGKLREHVVSIESSDIYDLAAEVEKYFDGLNPKQIANIFIERPWFSLENSYTASKQELSNRAKKIISSQRCFGAIRYLLYAYFPSCAVEEVSNSVAKQVAYDNSKVTKDRLISISRTFFDTYDRYSPTTELSIGDAYTLILYARKRFGA